MMHEQAPSPLTRSRAHLAESNCAHLAEALFLFIGRTSCSGHHCQAGLPKDNLQHATVYRKLTQWHRRCVSVYNHIATDVYQRGGFSRALRDPLMPGFWHGPAQSCLARKAPTEWIRMRAVELLRVVSSFPQRKSDLDLHCNSIPCSVWTSELLTQLNT